MSRLILTGNFVLDGSIGLASLMCGGEGLFQSAIWILPSSILTGLFMLSLSMVADANQRPDILRLGDASGNDGEANDGSDDAENRNPVRLP